MLRCALRRGCLRALRQERKPPLPLFEVNRHIERIRSYATITGIEESGSQTSLIGSPGKASKVDSLRWPPREQRHDSAQWLAALEDGLPFHLRKASASRDAPGMDAEELAQLILAAQSSTQTSPDVDLLCLLGIGEGRWHVVVWLVKHFVETFAPAHLAPERSSQSLCAWKNEQSLLEMTRRPIDLKQPAFKNHRGIGATTMPGMLDTLTDNLKPENYSSLELLERSILGRIWRSLGAMTIACADGEVKPEILEIIAYLHHKDLMSHSIYSQTPSADVAAVQQPPMLNLFSSRILTSLSDAAWRGHQKQVIAESRAKAADYAALRPEIPGDAYRVSVAGLRPEVWLELILWSCLHGGWIEEGCALLRKIAGQGAPDDWKPVSWISLLHDLKHVERDWNKLEYIFNTKPPSKFADVDRNSNVDVRRTISSEIINAYIDALPSKMRVGVGERGVTSTYVLEQLRIMKKFLERSSLSLGAGSWDALIIRVFDLQDRIVHQPGNCHRLARLSPLMGVEAGSLNVGELPPYVLDGTAATIGLFHHALRVAVHKADIRGALMFFSALQMQTEQNRAQSILDFFRKQKNRDRMELANGPFAYHTGGIEYPGFHMQIPATILAPFLQLVLDDKSYELGNWLLYDETAEDGPTIPQAMYQDPVMLPALVRFAAETNDKDLLSKLISRNPPQKRLPRSVLEVFFENQVTLQRWKAAAEIMESIDPTDYSDWNAASLAHVARVMLVRRLLATSGGEHDSDSARRAKSLFSAIVKGRYDKRRHRPDWIQEQMTLVSMVLSVLGEPWSSFCSIQPLGSYIDFTLPTRTFNILLQGIVEAHGSAKGRRVLGIFWPEAVRGAQAADRRMHRTDAGEPITSQFRPNSLDEAGRKRTVIDLVNPDKQIAIYGGLQPDFATIRIILNSALEELQKAQKSEDLDGTSNSPEGADAIETRSPPDTEERAYEVLHWAVERLHVMHVSDEDVKKELVGVLEDHGMRHLAVVIPRMRHEAGLTGGEQADNEDAWLDEELEGEPMKDAEGDASTSKV